MERKIDKGCNAAKSDQLFLSSEYLWVDERNFNSYIVECFTFLWNVLLSTQVHSFTLRLSGMPLGIYALIELSDYESVKVMKNVIEF